MAPIVSARHDRPMPAAPMLRDEVLTRLSSLRQHQHNGKRSPHKPLLMLLALGRLAAQDSSALPWQVARFTLADLIREFGPPTSTAATQSAAYPFTRLRADGVWVLDHDVPMDRIQPLTEHQVVGRLVLTMKAALRDPQPRTTVLRSARCTTRCSTGVLSA